MRSTLAIVLALLAPGCAAPEADPSLRVVTYNLRHGVGMDDALDLERIAAALNALDADVIALQEVDQGAARSGRVSQAERLGGLTLREHAFGAFMDFDGGQYGLALLSRFPIVATESVRLPDGHEPRLALVAELALPAGRRVHVACVHFDWVDDDGFRFAQAARLTEHLRTLDAPFVVLGDFNDEPGSRTLDLFDALATRAEVAGDAATWPADAPRVAIDHVFAGPPDAWSVGPARVVDERAASDHRPMVAELALREPARSQRP